MNIITRGDFDGLVCTVLLTEAEKISEIRFAHPRSMQEREVPVSGQDIIVNLPYQAGCAMWFDHHISEFERGPKPENFKGKYGLAPSCARLIYDYYKKPGWERYADLLEATDKIDSAQLDLNDILRPQGWTRLSCTVDPRSGFAPSQEYFMYLVDLIKDYPIGRILDQDEVRDRVREFFKEQEEFKKALHSYSYVRGKVIVTDLRRLQKTPIGSRFLIYALYPTANVSVRAFFSDDRDYVMIAVGHSILNRTCQVDVGNLMAEYGGGGHVGAGSCRIPADMADEAISDIVERLGEGGTTE